MQMYGLSESFTIVIAAIVVLIVALIILTIFGAGVSTATSIYDAKNQCNSMCRASCRTTGQTPITYTDLKIKYPGGVVVCGTAAQCTCTPDEIKPFLQS